MNERETYLIRNRFRMNEKPSEEDIFLYTEAMDYLIYELKNPQAMLELGGYYYEKKNFDLALKYYEMAAEYKLPYAYEGLGYIWYYGRTGRRDFEKAFHYYSLAKEAGITEAAVKVADMYKNGYFVELDYGKYKEIIEALYPKVRKAQTLGEPVPEVFTRLAMIRKEEGKISQAVRLLLEAKDFQAQRRCPYAGICRTAQRPDCHGKGRKIDEAYFSVGCGSDQTDLSQGCEASPS